MYTFLVCRPFPHISQILKHTGEKDMFLKRRALQKVWEWFSLPPCLFARHKRMRCKPVWEWLIWDRGVGPLNTSGPLKSVFNVRHVGHGALSLESGTGARWKHTPRESDPHPASRLRSPRHRATRALLDTEPASSMRTLIGPVGNIRGSDRFMLHLEL